MAANATATKKTTKKNRTPLTYTLVAIQRDEAGKITGYVPVPQPKIEKMPARRDDFRRAVKDALTKGDESAVEHYNGKQLTVIGHPAPFCFNAKVEEEIVKKVVITES